MAHTAIQGRIEPASETIPRIRAATNRNSASFLPSPSWVFGGEEERGGGEISPRAPQEKLLTQISTYSTAFANKDSLASTPKTEWIEIIQTL